MAFKLGDRICFIQGNRVLDANVWGIKTVEYDQQYLQTLKSRDQISSERDLPFGYTNKNRIFTVFGIIDAKDCYHTRKELADAIFNNG